jgi:hypothetical protein
MKRVVVTPTTIENIADLTFFSFKNIPKIMDGKRAY